MEACAGAHFIARQLTVAGHETKLISPQFVRPYVKGNKNDFVDAEAICEAASRPSMRFVSPKTEAQQTLSILHRIRESLVRDRTKTANQMHGFLLEFGISLPRGLAFMKRLPQALNNLDAVLEGTTSSGTTPAAGGLLFDAGQMLGVNLIEYPRTAGSPPRAIEALLNARRQ